MSEHVQVRRWGTPAKFVDNTPGFETAFVATGFVVWVGVAVQSVVTVLSWLFGGG
jgi:hypothetical protein